MTDEGSLVNEKVAFPFIIFTPSFSVKLLKDISLSLVLKNNFIPNTFLIGCTELGCITLACSSSQHLAVTLHTSKSGYANLSRFFFLPLAHHRR